MYVAGVYDFSDWVDLGPVHTRKQCRKPAFCACVSVNLMVPQMQVANVVHFHAPDHIVE